MPLSICSSTFYKHTMFARVTLYQDSEFVSILLIKIEFLSVIPSSWCSPPASISTSVASKSLEMPLPLFSLNFIFLSFFPLFVTMSPRYLSLCSICIKIFPSIMCYWVTSPVLTCFTPIYLNPSITGSGYVTSVCDFPRNNFLHFSDPNCSFFEDILLFI